MTNATFQRYTPPDTAVGSNFSFTVSGFVWWRLVSLCFVQNGQAAGADANPSIVLTDSSGAVQFQTQSSAAVLAATTTQVSAAENMPYSTVNTTSGITMPLPSLTVEGDGTVRVVNISAVGTQLTNFVLVLQGLRKSQ